MDPFLIFVFTKVASTEGLLAVVGIIIVIALLQRNTQRAFAFAITTLGLIVSTLLLKETFQVARPENSLVEATGYAFPSGHATGAIFLALIVIYLSRTLPARVRYAVYTASAMLALAIAVSRVGFGVHTPLQVAAGCILGAFWAYVAVRLDRRSR